MASELDRVEQLDDILEPEPDMPRSVVDRRSGADRRQKDMPIDGPDRRVAADARRTGLERRRGAGIRREESRRSAEEGEMTTDQFEFIQAIEAYKRVNKRLYPTWTEVLEVIQALGYRQVEAPTVDLAPGPQEKAA